MTTKFKACLREFFAAFKPSNSSDRYTLDIFMAGLIPDPVSRKRALAAVERRKVRRERYQEAKTNRLRAKLAAINAELAGLKALSKRNRT